MNNFRILVYTLGLLLPIWIGAQKADQDYKAFKEKYNTDDFQYVIKPEKSPSEPKNYQWIEDLIKFLENIEWKYGLYIIFGLVIILILYKLYQNGSFFRMTSEKKLHKETEIFDYIEKNLLTIDLWDLIDKAKKNKDFRLAIRYYHYQNTQKLAQKEYIKWDPKKTNQQLINEIKADNVKALFQENTGIFNHVWFGNFELTQDQFEQFELKYQQMNQLI